MNDSSTVKQDLSPEAAARRAFFYEITRRFTTGFVETIANGGDTFAFDFGSLSDVPGWEAVKAGAASAGMAGDTPMTLVVLVRPKAMADPMLEAMQMARDADVVDVVEAAEIKQE